MPRTRTATHQRRRRFRFSRNLSSHPTSQRGGAAGAAPPQRFEMRPLPRGVLLVLVLVLFHSMPARSTLAPGPDAFGYSAAVTTAFSFLEITNAAHVLYFADDEAVT